jgi:hypothetical protein
MAHDTLLRSTDGESNYIHTASVWMSLKWPPQGTYRDRLKLEAIKFLEKLPSSVPAISAAVDVHLAQTLRLGQAARAILCEMLLG